MNLGKEFRGSCVCVVDKDKTTPQRVYIRYDHETSQSIYETKQVPKIMASVYPTRAQCCGIGEISKFTMVVRKKEVAEMLAEHINEHLFEQKYSLVIATFLREGKQKRFKNELLMKALEKAGWKKMTSGFVNRRYQFNQKKEGHFLQPLVYLIDRNKKGNAYVEADAVQEPQD